MGTFGWSLRGASDPREEDYNFGEGHEISLRGGHFDPRNFSSLGPRVPVEASGALFYQRSAVCVIQ